LTTSSSSRAPSPVSTPSSDATSPISTPGWSSPPCSRWQPALQVPSEPSLPSHMSRRWKRLKGKWSKRWN